MGIGHKNKEAKEFIQNLFKTYLEERNFEKFELMLCDNITWFGTGEQEICLNFNEALALLNAEKESLNSSFKLDYKFIEAKEISENAALVYGVFALREASQVENQFSLSAMIRFSMVCVLINGEFKLMNAHISLPNTAQNEDEFIHQKMIDEYNQQLEQKLFEGTKLLNEKTMLLERITNNIFGGVEICHFDQDYTIEYVSDGFEKITGYSREELGELHQNKHVNLIYPADRKEVGKKVNAQLENGDSFTVEYRIVKKDNTVMWVLDNGIRLPYDDKKLQCILTDITRQKMQEEELRISEQRYDIALKSSGLTMFEYNIVTKELTFFNGLSSMYMLPSVVPNGPETLINRGNIQPVSVDGYREMYKKIHAGVPQASCYITSKDANNVLHDYELTLTTVFDTDGKPIRAIGVRKNVSAMLMLKKEREFGKSLVAGRNFVFEANFNTNQITDIDEDWARNNGITDKMTLSQLIDFIADKLIAKEYAEIFKNNLNPEYLLSQFQKGDNLVSFSYKIMKNENEFLWHEGTVNVIEDDKTKILYGRFYFADIHEKKIKEQYEAEERRIYEVMTERKTLAYQFNITKNLALKGHEGWIDAYGIQKSDDYNLMINEFAHQVVHKEDSSIFINAFKREAVLKKFYDGCRQVSAEYRKRNEDDVYKWSSCVFHLYESPETGDVKGFAYVEDIDEQKNAQLTLQYNAEHDLMTGLYNKITTASKIDDFLLNADAETSCHAFAMIDFDLFKNINDQFGHAFGDKVLVDMSMRLKGLFREKDIVGRIGGDEFCVFVQNIKSKEDMINKANSICQKLNETYIRNDVEFKISASVGVALFPLNGSSYEELYKHADIALYKAKKAGRNRYYIHE